MPIKGREFGAIGKDKVERESTDDGVDFNRKRQGYCWRK